MKRHTVMDLFYDHLKDPVDGDWNEYKPNIQRCKLLVKLKDDSQTYAYFYGDGAHGHYFWSCKSKEPLDNVKTWKFLKESCEKSES